MCIIAAIKAGTEIDEETFKRCATKNPDGFGIYYTEKGKVVVRKTMKSRELWDFYQEAKDAVGKKSPIVLHFRIGTSGVMDTTNCHPFYVNEDLAFSHNGIIRTVGYDKDISDTQLFNNKILKKLDKGFLENKTSIDLIGSYINSDKLVFLDNKAKLSIINEDRGMWDGGIWYSNGGFKAPAPRSIMLRHYAADKPVICGCCHKIVAQSKTATINNEINITMCNDCLKDLFFDIESSNFNIEIGDKLKWGTNSTDVLEVTDFFFASGQRKVSLKASNYKTVVPITSLKYMVKCK